MARDDNTHEALRSTRMGGGRERLQLIGTATIIGLSIFLWLLCLIAGICLAVRGSSTDCIIFLQWGLIAIGLFLVATFIMVVSCYRHYKGVTMGLYMLVMFLVLLSLMIVAFVHINIKAAVVDGPDTSDTHELKRLNKPQPVRDSLGDYGGRLRHRVADRRYWARFSGCLRHRHACNGMSPLVRDPNTGVLLAKRTSKKYPHDFGLSPIEPECCKPPLSCGFTYVNQTTWKVPGVPTNNTNDDCSRWSNDQEKLCFQCDSCKAGVLADVQRAWSKTIIVMTFITALQNVLYPCVVVALGSND